MVEPMPEERVEELKQVVVQKEPRSFRVELHEALREIERLREANEEMRRLVIVGELESEVVAFRCERVARDQDSSLHEVAALMIRRLLAAIEPAFDAAEDGKQSGAAAILLAEFVEKTDKPCRYGQDGFCQTHGCGKPCLLERARSLLKKRK